MNITIDLKAEAESVARYYCAWADEYAALDRMRADCAASHISPPENYWKAERAARRKFEQAALILEALQNASSEALT